MCLVKQCDIPARVWNTLKSWTDNLNKVYVPSKAQVFTFSELESYIEAAPPPPPGLQECAMIIIAYSSGLRLVENYSLEWKDLTFRTAPAEVSVTIKKTKGNAEGRYFLITNLKHIEIILKYRGTYLNTKLKDTGPLYRCWNVLAGKWSSTRRGRRWFQDIPKKIARFLKKDEKWYTHHSLRRSMASQLHTNGATRLHIKYAGGWKSDKVVEGYVISSEGEKRRTADLVAQDVSIDRILPGNKKVAELNPLKPLNPKKKIRL